jgi:ADP-ribosyl-[dinitrogen reductase] hydrolase
MNLYAASRTSETDPIRIDFIRPDEGWGLIGMSFCPGKKQMNARSGDWDRDLDADLSRIQEWGAGMVVSLIETPEFETLQVVNLPETVTQMGMSWRHLPIRDRYPPNNEFCLRWQTVAPEILSTLASGKNVFLHCMGGLGRTGLVAACILIESGLDPEEAIKKVRKARPKTIETAVQEYYVMNYRQIIEKALT